MITNDKEGLDKFCEENGFIGWFETSAKSEEATGIDEATRSLVQSVLDYKPKEQPKPNVKQNVKIKNGEQPQEDSGCC